MVAKKPNGSRWGGAFGQEEEEEEGIHNVPFGRKNGADTPGTIHCALV